MAYVLIVDDDEDLSSAMATVLRNEGYEVEVELDSKNAIARMKGRVPDAVVLDVMFPDSPSAGFDVARNMRASGGDLGTVPVLMLTSVNQESSLQLDGDDIDDAWLPVNEFMEKPVDFEKLKKKVADLLKKAAGQ